MKAFIKSCSINSRNELSPKCEVVYKTKLTSEISLPTDSCLAQSVEHWTDEFNPQWGQFFIVLFSVNAGRILAGFDRK